PAGRKTGFETARGGVVEPTERSRFAQSTRADTSPGAEGSIKAPSCVVKVGDTPKCLRWERAWSERGSASRQDHERELDRRRRWRGRRFGPKADRREPARHDALDGRPNHAEYRMQFFNDRA